MYVAKITDNMLLGHDVLLKYEVIIDLGECCLIVLDCFIPFSKMSNDANKKSCMSKVSLSQKLHIPPRRVQNVEVILQSEQGNGFTTPL